MKIIHLTASSFFGGPERQLIGLSRELVEHAHSTLVSFSEGGRCRSFLAEVKKAGLDGLELTYDTPKFGKCINEIAKLLDESDTDVLFCHGYKANILGRFAARRVRLPVIAVSRGWTAENYRIWLYECLDRYYLRYMDRVIAVSVAQARKIINAGVMNDRICVIHNAVDPERFVDPDPRYRNRLERLFNSSTPTRIAVSAGRLSPEKGFDILIAAAALVLEAKPDVGFVIFGDGPLKEVLQQQITYLGLNERVVLSGFRSDLDRFLSQSDLFILPSYTEGLPNVVLEACAAGVPVVATSVGGTPEVIEDNSSGWLVAPGDSEALANRILDALECDDRLRDVAFMGRQRVLEEFSFPTQAARYIETIKKVCQGRSPLKANTGAIEPSWNR